MMKIFLIIFIFECALGDEESYEKFIDLLPEEEKREFLDRVARRILEEINTDNVPDKSQVEIPDDQLEVHDAYVKDILKEETDRLKDEKKIGDSVRMEEPSDDGDNGDDNNRHLDLTLRTGKRSKRKNVDHELETTIEMPFNVIPVEDVHDNETNVEASNEELKEKSITTRETNFTSNNNKNENNTTSEYIKKDEPSNNERDDFEEEVRTDESATVGSNISTTAFTIHTIISNEKTNSSDFKNVTVQQMETENTSEIFNHPFQRMGALNINENVSNVVDTTTINIDDLKIDSSIQLTTSPNDISKVNHSDNITKILKITNNEETQATNSILNSTSVIKTEDVESADVINEENNSNDKIEEPKTRLRSGSEDIEDSKEDNKVFIKKLHNKTGLGNEYEVYEIAPEKTPFTLINNVKINEQQHYVPIYEYAPEKAYFRPYDRFGPNFESVEQEYIQNYNNIRDNIDEENTHEFIVPNKRSRFASYNKNNHRPYKIQNNNFPNNKGNSKIYGFMKPVNYLNQKMYYNPYDYFDLDYNNRYNGRSFLRKSKYRSKYKPFPNSDEQDHPYNSIYKSKTLKDHVGAIRNILYLQQVFGYVPTIDRENRKFDERSKKNRYENFFENPRSDDIGIDYYYDRDITKSTEKSIRGNISKFKLFKKLKNKEPIRNLQTNINSINQKQTSGLSSNENANKLNDILEDDNKFSSFFDALLNVTEDNIRFDNEGLQHYDWLKTSVDIQSAVRKLLNLAESLQYAEHIHPKDLELLKYSLYQFKSSQVILRDGPKKSFGRNVKKRKQKTGILPKGNRNRNRIKQPLKLWKDFAKYLRTANNDGSEQKMTLLYDFEDFLQKVLNYLNEFHDAVKHVAIVTRFQDQNWFYDLKQIFFKNATRKELGQVILHLSLVNLLDRVEEDAVNGSEISFREFVENNSRAVNNTRKEFIFVLPFKPLRNGRFVMDVMNVYKCVEKQNNIETQALLKKAFGSFNAI
nr:uncharacterized protein DDB_G0286591-like [Vanessa tameamea]